MTNRSCSECGRKESELCHKAERELRKTTKLYAITLLFISVVCLTLGVLLGVALTC